MRAASAVIGLGLVAAVAAAPAYAGGSHTRIIHRSYDEKPSISRMHGIGPGCPAFVGTFIEHRHVVMNGYARDDLAHLSWVVTATVTLRPDAAAAVSYRGSYRAVEAGVYRVHGRPRTDSTLTVGTIHGTDGSSFQTVEVEHIWHDKNGKPHHTERFNCS